MNKHKKLEEHIFTFLSTNSVDVKDLCYNDRCIFDSKYDKLVESILTFVDTYYRRKDHDDPQE